MTISERIQRNEAEDKIEIGYIAEKLVAGDKGVLLKCLVEGIKDDFLDRSDRNTNISAERALGVQLGLRKLQDALDQCVSDKNQLLAEKKVEDQQ
jgi:hypothetical protein